MDTSKYKELFLSEAREHLDSLDSGLIKLERSPKDSAILTELMMHAHSLKGIAATAGFGEIANLAHSFEGMVENLKNNLAKGGIDLLFGAVDELKRLVNLAETLTTANPLTEKTGELEESDLAEDVNIVKAPEKFRVTPEVRVRTEKLDRIMDLAAELVINKLRLATAFSTNSSKLTEAIEENNRFVEDLQYQVLQLRLTPIAEVFNRFPRMIRDLAKSQGKDIDLIVQGGEIELDREVLDNLGEPLVHLLRNAIDHGIEKEGKITLSAQRVRDQAIITVSDNGRGIDWKKISSIGRFAPGQESQEKLNSLLFSGISTSEQVSEVSGRGIGLPVVKSKIEELGGTVDVSSEKAGTTFTLRLPVSLAIVKALLITVGKRTYAIPLTNVERLINLGDIELKKEANQEVAVIDGKAVPLIRMSQVLKVQSEEENPVVEDQKSQTVLLARFKDRLMGFIIDSVEAQQDIIVKPLAKALASRLNFLAATILGEGKPVPIIDIESLVESIEQ